MSNHVSAAAVGKVMVAQFLAHQRCCGDALGKPKFQYCLHLPRQTPRFGMLLNCGPMERKRK
eukprot:2900869-Pyramimonas_sp.AAC.1